MVYVFFDPFSALTVITKLFSPTLSSCSPVPETDALESLALAFIVIFLISLVKSTLYVVLSAENTGDKVPEEILNEERLFSLERVSSLGVSLDPPDEFPPFEDPPFEELPPPFEELFILTETDLLPVTGLSSVAVTSTADTVTVVLPDCPAVTVTLALPSAKTLVVETDPFDADTLNWPAPPTDIVTVNFPPGVTEDLLALTENDAANTLRQLKFIKTANTVEKSSPLIILFFFIYFLLTKIIYLFP